jgi:hypothetical protein
MHSLVSVGMATIEQQAPAAAWSELIGAIRRERVVVVEQSLARIRTLDSYQGVEDASLRSTVESRVEMILDGLDERRPPGLPADARESEIYGEMRASQGVTFADLLTGWRAGSRAFVRLAAELAPPSPHRDTLLVELVLLMLQWVDHASLAMATGHRRGELAHARELQHVHSNLTRRMLDGIAPGAEIRAGLVALGLDPDADYVAVRARPGPAATTDAIERYLGVDGLHGRRCGVTTLIDGDLCGFLTGELPRTPAPTAIGISEPAPAAGLDAPFRRATRALETAIAFQSDGIFPFSSLAVQASVLSDPDVGHVLRSRYLDALEDSPVVLGTAEQFLANDGSIDATAAALGVHPNTVRKRLERFEERTGRSPRDSETAVELWWALQDRRLKGGPAAERAAGA